MPDLFMEGIEYSTHCRGHFRRGSIVNAVIFLVVLVAVVLAGIFLIGNRVVAWGLFGVVFLGGVLLFSDVPELVGRVFARARKKRQRKMRREEREVRAVLKKLSRLDPSSHPDRDSFIEAARGSVPPHLSRNGEILRKLASLREEGT